MHRVDAESSPAQQPVKHIVINPPINKCTDVEKASMAMKALNTFSSCNDVNKIPASSSNSKPQIMISSTTKSTTHTTKPHYRIIKDNNKPSCASASLFKHELLKDQPQGVIPPKIVHISESQPGGYPIINGKPIHDNHNFSGNNLRFLKGHGFQKVQFQNVIIPKTVPITDGSKPFQGNSKHSDNSVSLLKGHKLVNNQSQMVTISNNKPSDSLLEFGDEQTSNNKSCDPLLDGQTGLQNFIFHPPDPSQSQGYNLNRKSPESNSVGLHRLRPSAMNLDDPSEFAEFRKLYTLSPANKTFRNELLSSTKKANFEKTSMVTILFNLVNICEKHVFDQNVHVQVIMNLVCEIAQIPECKKSANQILSKCVHILSETFNDMNAMVDQCAKLQTIQTKINTENNTFNTKTESVNNSNCTSNHVKSHMIAETGNIKIEPEYLENEVDIPMDVDNVDEQVKEQLIHNEEEEEELESVHEDNGQIEKEYGDNGQIKEEYGDNGQIEKEYGDNGQIKEEYGDNGQVEEEYGDNGQVEEEYGDNGQIEEVNGQIEEDYEDDGEKEIVYENDGQIQTEMEEEEQLDNDKEIVHIVNGTEQVDDLNIENSLNVENEKQYSEEYSDNPPSLSDNEHENEFDESSESKGSETEVINEYMSDDPDWNPDEYFESSQSSKMPKEPKKPKEPKEPKEPKKPKERKKCKGNSGECHICGKTFKDLNCHKITHKVERPEKCPHCDFQAKTKKSLRLHMNMHISERNFQCEQCGSMFRTLNILKIHLLVHSKEMLFSCGYCSNKYKRRTTLKNHEKIHKEEYAYICTFCDKKFIQAINLKTHMRTHTGEKPYKCDRCGEGFAHNVTKKLHRKTCFVEKGHS